MADTCFSSKKCGCLHYSKRLAFECFIKTDNLFVEKKSFLMIPDHSNIFVNCAVLYENKAVTFDVCCWLNENDLVIVEKISLTPVDPLKDKATPITSFK